GVKFIVCGNGDSHWLTARIAELGRSADFDFRGPVEDIRSVLETLDIYGYPLCPDTYAAAELNLQEAMFAGLPVVTFPHGGIGKLVQHGETGILVNTPEEYARAIEQLHQNPAERERLGANAAAFARRHWGAESAAREFNVQFERLLTLPKRSRQWNVPPGAAICDLPPSLADRISEVAVYPGARLFLESLDDAAQPFLDSLSAATLEEMLAADDRLAEMSRLMHQNGVICYRYMYPKDPFIQLWAGLGFRQAGKFSEALDAFNQAAQNNFPHWRVQWHRALAAERAGKPGDIADALQKVVQVAPNFAPARALQQRAAAEARPRPLAAPVVVPGQAVFGCLQQADRCIRANQPGQAREWLVRALDLAPRDLELIETLAELDCRMGNLEAGRKGYASVMMLDPLRKSPALEFIREASGLKPKIAQTNQPVMTADVQMFVQAARTALGRQDPSLALNALQTAHRINPQQAGILVALGSLQVQTGDFFAAVETLARAAALAPNDALTQVMLARAFIKLGRIAEFEAALGRALEVNSTFAPAHRFLGDLLLENQQPADAANHYRTALENSAPNSDLLLALASCLEMCGETQAAAARRNEAGQLAGAHSPGHEIIALLERLAPQTNSRTAGSLPVDVCAPLPALNLALANERQTVSSP
ncbi:MAG TPA: tetratricopeptide repeat protein, partial [Verrucomicrobiae bacterium]|nr:tetratricopeptide repeat protein [Verrucomicrobiae bacterium]